MIDQDTSFAESRRRFYENDYRVGEPIDAWHDHAQEVVHSVTRSWFYTMGLGKGNRVLNAGSGGSDYGIHAPMLHLDLLASRISHLPRFVVANVSEIPADDSSFDVVLCVGSVLNYTNPIHAIREFCRVLRSGGLLILEYERSGCVEYWRKYGLSAACVRVESFYGAARTQLWVYGDEFINGLLAIHSFKTQKEARFHGVSSMVLAITGSPHVASRFVWRDRKLANLWPIRNMASNRILAVEKLAD